MRARGRRVRRRRAHLLGRIAAIVGVFTIVVPRLFPVAPAHATPAAGTATPGTTTPIKHVVFMIMENHSFDNVLGAWCVKTGRCDGATSGSVAGVGTIPLTKATDVVANVIHDGDDQVLAIDGGRMDGFAGIGGCSASTGYACYSQYQPSQIPNVITLAKHFALSDHTFGDGPMASWGMHIDAVTASMDGFTGNSTPSTGQDGTLGPGWGCDSGDDAAWTSPSGTNEAVPSCVPDPVLDPSTYPFGGAYRATPVAHVPTIMDELDAAGLSWRIYAGLGGTDNSNGYGWAICPTFADCLDTDQDQNVVSSSRVLTDARAGDLPDFSVITPTQADSEHNYDSMTQGDNWIGQVLTAIEGGPDWASTAVFLTWDDCGCFYDHVAPPAGESIRVPMLVISPYAIAGHTDSDDADYASVLAFTEHDFELPAMSSLDADAYDYSGLFDFDQTPLKPVAMKKEKVSAAEQRYLKAHPPDPDDPT